MAYIDRHGVYHEVAPNLWLGLRLRAWELPEFITLVVDLTCEYTRHRQWTCAYLCVPTLDDAVPDRAQYERAIVRVVNWSGPVYVHCAAGAGRSALLAAGVLLRRGLAATPAAAEAMLRERRAVVHLQPGQRQFLQQFQADATLEGTNGLDKQC